MPGPLNGPHLHLLGHDAPVSVVVVRGDDVQVLHVALDQLVQLALPEHVVVPVVGDGPAAVVRRQRVLRRGARERGGARLGLGDALGRLLHGGLLPDELGGARRPGRLSLLGAGAAVTARRAPVGEAHVAAAVGRRVARLHGAEGGGAGRLAGARAGGAGVPPAVRAAARALRVVTAVAGLHGAARPQRRDQSRPQHVVGLHACGAV